MRVCLAPKLLIIDEFGVGPTTGDAVIATAILIVLNIRDESYRLREREQAGLFGVSSTPLAVVSEDFTDKHHGPRPLSTRSGERWSHEGR